MRRVCVELNHIYSNSQFGTSNHVSMDYHLAHTRDFKTYDYTQGLFPIYEDEGIQGSLTDLQPGDYVSCHRAALCIESCKFPPGIEARKDEPLQNSPNGHVVYGDVIPMTCGCISIALSKLSHSVFHGALRSIRLIVYGFCNPMGLSAFWHSWPA